MLSMMLLTLALAAPMPPWPGLEDQPAVALTRPATLQPGTAARVEVLLPASPTGGLWLITAEDGLLVRRGLVVASRVVRATAQGATVRLEVANLGPRAVRLRAGDVIARAVRIAEPMAPPDGCGGPDGPDCVATR